MKTRSFTLSISIMAFICLFFCSSAISKETRKNVSPSDLYKAMMKKTTKTVGRYATFLGRHDDDLSLLKKRAENNTFRTDTLIRYSVYGGSEKTVNTFDNDGRLLTSYTKVWIIDKWASENVITNVYDADGNLLTVTNQLYRSNTWINYRMLTHTYDGTGNCLNTLGQQWDGTAWANYGQSDYTYDINGNMLTELFQEWDGTAWLNNTFSTYTYDASGNVLTMLDQYWDGSAWSDNILDSWTYDGAGHMLTYLSQQWDGTVWFNNYLRTYTYDGNGNVISVLEQNWDGAAWINVALFTLTYNANNLPLSLLYSESYDGVTWSDMSRSEWTYNASGNPLTFKTSISDWVTGELQNYTLTEYTYEDGIITADGFTWTGTSWTIGDAYFPVTVNENGIETEFFNGGPSVRAVVHYSSALIGITVPEGDQSGYFTIYPNPADDYLTVIPASPDVKTGKVQMFDPSGKEQQIALINNRIDLGKMQKGVYFIRITTLDGQTLVRKIVKQ